MLCIFIGNQGYHNVDHYFSGGGGVVLCIFIGNQGYHNFDHYFSGGGGLCYAFS